MIFLGLYLAIWLISSEPILPPPPVTNTILSWIKSNTSLVLIFISSLPNKSSNFIFLNCVLKFPSSIKLSTLGNILTDISFSLFNSFKILEILLWSTEGIEIIIFETSFFSTIFSTSSRPPKTFKPYTFPPFLLGL